MPRRDYSGNATTAELSNSISATDLSITINDAAGWPSGGASGKFFITIDRGLSNEERVLVASRTGTVLTVAAVGDRGVDDTLAATHDTNATVEHGLAAVDADEANAHIFDTSRDDHTQLLNNARHDVEARHQFGAALGEPGAPADIGTAAAAGTGDDAAREDHVHKIGTGAINASGQFAAGVVNAAAMGTDSVTAVKIATGAVTNTKLGADAVDGTKIADDAVGSEHLADGSVINAALGLAAVTAAKITNGSIFEDKIADGAVTTAKLDDAAVTGAKILDATIGFVKIASGGATAYVPTFGGLTGSSNTIYGRYFKIGRIVFGWAGFTIGAGGNILTDMTVSVPFVSANAGANYICAVRGTHPSTGARATGMGLVVPNSSIGESFATIGAGTWGVTSPWNWDVGDTFQSIFVYESAV